MKTTTSVVLLAGLGTLALALPAAASPTSRDVHSGTPAVMQVAQNQTRAINEQRGGDYKKKKKVQKLN